MELPPDWEEEDLAEEALVPWFWKDDEEDEELLGPCKTIQNIRNIRGVSGSVHTVTFVSIYTRTKDRLDKSRSVLAEA